jgi:HlyD family secretion protein
MVGLANSPLRAGTAMLIAAMWLGAGGCNRTPLTEPAGAASSAGPRRVVSLGRLEPAGGIISISALPGERLKSLAPGVEEGAQVEAGQVLAHVASFDLRQTQLDAIDAKLDISKKQRQYEIAAAEAQLEQAIAGRAQAKAKHEEAAAQRYRLQNLAEAAAIAEEDYQRLAELQADDPELVTDHQLRRQRNLSDRATKEYEAASATFPPAVLAAEKAVEAAEASVKLAERQLDMAKNVDQSVAVEMEKKVAEETRDQSVLRAPRIEGGSTHYTVLKILMQPGEVVTQLPVLELGDLSRMVCVAEVYEADAKELKVGQPATIRSPAFSGKFADGNAGDAGGIPGKVVRIGTLVGNPGLTNRNPLAPSDRSVVEVRVAIDPENVEATREAARRIGLQVTVEFGEQATEAQKGEPK